MPVPALGLARPTCVRDHWELIALSLRPSTYAWVCLFPFSNKQTARQRLLIFHPQHPEATVYNHRSSPSRHNTQSHPAPAAASTSRTHTPHGAATVNAHAAGLPATQSFGRLDAELRAAPVTPLGVVPVVVSGVDGGGRGDKISQSLTPHTKQTGHRGQIRTPHPAQSTSQTNKRAHAPDGVARAEADPVGDGAVLVRLLGKGPLGAERLLGRLWGWLVCVIDTRGVGWSGVTGGEMGFWGRDAAMLNANAGRHCCTRVIDDDGVAHDDPTHTPSQSQNQGSRPSDDRHAPSIQIVHAPWLEAPWG